MITILHTLFTRAFLLALVFTLVAYLVGRLYGWARGWATGYSEGRTTEKRIAASRERAHAKMAVLAIKTAATSKPLPEAKRDHVHPGELRLRPIGKRATAGRL